MVLIPYKPDGTAYPAYGIAGDSTNENIYQRQHNIVEYQQVKAHLGFFYADAHVYFSLIEGNTADDSRSNRIPIARHATSRGLW